MEANMIAVFKTLVRFNKLPCRGYLAPAIMSLILLSSCENYSLIPITARTELRNCVLFGCIPFQQYGDLGSPRLYLIPTEPIMRNYLAAQGVSMEQFAASEAGREFVRQHTFVGDKLQSGTFTNLNELTYTFTCATEAITNSYQCDVEGIPIILPTFPSKVTEGGVLSLEGILSR